MAIKVYSKPDEIKSVDTFIFKNSKFDREASLKAEAKYAKKFKDYCIKHGKGKYKGETVKFSVADGYAIYYILECSPMELIHYDEGDAYNFPYIERLNKSDIVEQINFDKQFNDM
jgi:hypothetical protein